MTSTTGPLPWIPYTGPELTEAQCRDVEQRVEERLDAAQARYAKRMTERRARRQGNAA